jgi:uncharacterized membrane protein
MTITFAFLHHLAFVAMFVGLAGEMILLRQPLHADGWNLRPEDRDGDGCPRAVRGLHPLCHDCDDRPS